MKTPKCICGHQGTRHLHLVDCPFYRYMHNDYLRGLKSALSRKRAKQVKE